MAGEPYTGGGIATTVAATRAATDDELRAHTAPAASREMRALGTTTVEIKSGYGLDVADEARLLRDRRASSPPRPRSSGAHVVPAEYADDRAAYVDLVVRRDARRLRAATRAGSTSSATRAPSTPRRRARVLRGGRRRGPACRGCTATSSRTGPGVQIAVEFGAASVDHCTHLTDDDVDALAGSERRRDAAAGAPSSRTRSPYPDARRLLDAGVTVALATDCNPGHVVTSPRCRSCIALAVREMRMTPAEALVAGDRAVARRRCAETTSAALRQGARPTSSCSMRRRTRTSRTGPARRSWPGPGGAANGSSAPLRARPFA